MKDLIIVGAGPAGITAAIYAARKMMDFTIITKDIGGQAAISGDIENYLGYQFVTGPELAAKFEQHMKTFKIDLKENEAVTSIKRAGGSFSIKTDKSSYEAKTVIIASGKKSRLLNVPGEEEFKNKGVSYCATCDAPIFAGKAVAIIGGGNSAFDAALQLVKIATKVYVINVSAKPIADAVMAQKVASSPNATIMNDTKIIRIKGDKFVNSITIETGGRAQELRVEGVFVEIGQIPNTDIIDFVELNKQMEIVVNCDTSTSVPGLFAAGDVTNVPEKQIIIAAGEGSKALLTAFKYLSTH